MSHLGDIVQTMPLVHAIRAAWPGAEIGWAIQPEFAPLVEPFAKIFPFDRRGGARAWPRLRSEMRAWRPDMTLDAQGNWKSAVCTRLSGAPRRHGFERRAWQEPFAARVAGLVHAPPPESSGRHLVALCRSIAAFITGDAALAERIDPLLSEAEIARGRGILESVREGAARTSWTVLHPGVAGDPRTWPAESFEALGRRLLERGERVLYLTGPGEAETGRALGAAVPGAAHLVGQRGLRDLCAILHAVAKGDGQIFVSDSGPAHVAASVGLPVRLLAGPEDPERTGPWPLVTSSETPHRLVPAGGLTAWTARPIGAVTVEDALSVADR
ncbi:Lipopolysaccharide core heptosyltransferase RfaQ [Planctomycetes bacterium Poly30]|uniref:Lipopolysaccharide core heptosyltransferase RfaQ n=2 Tax=Saltatorellus ferox TaxID=2528018 RepID=A0A518EQ73_9BACT|nr:Lipopolysaccharide core heptosyltransferase RfaQ [Planctomycetes bacterium Poly30]